MKPYSIEWCFLFSGHGDGQQIKRQRPLSPVEVTEDDYKNLLRNHKKKKLMMSQVQITYTFNQQ